MIHAITAAEILVMAAVGVAVGVSQDSFGWAIVAVGLLGITFSLVGVVVIAVRGGKPELQQVAHLFRQSLRRTLGGGTGRSD
jgi:hypothetical protein